MSALTVGWPAALQLVRHAESEGNVANVAARRSGAARLDVNVNDVEIPLSDTGKDQAQALGRWFRDADPEQRPTAVLVSPYARARQTTELVLAEAGLDHIPVTYDERLRDREQGVLDRLTTTGFRDQYPDESARRDYVGKFWFRPSGGESWADVALRMRAVVLDMRLAMAGERILVVSHDVPIIIARYILENLSADAAVALSGQVRNCSVTSYVDDGAGLALRSFNDVSALERDDDAAVTAHE
jgi:broad specificity phosphatase PhoE